MKIEFNHHLNQNEAARKIDYFMDQLNETQQYTITNVQGQWSDDQTRLDFAFLIQGQRIAGLVKNQPETIIIEADLPFPIRLFQGKVEESIREKLTAAFA